MIKIRISGYSDSKRNVWLTLPATEEQINQAFDKLLKGVPIGKTFAYHITSKECAYHQVAKRIQHNSELNELNLLAYMLQNLKGELRNTALVIAGYKAAPDDLSGFINEIAAVKSGWYDLEYDELNGTYLVLNFDSKPDVYRRHFMEDWLEVERVAWEQRHTADLQEIPQIENGDTPEMSEENCHEWI